MRAILFIWPKTSNPLDPAIDRWLRSLEPRQKLVVRFAVLRCFAEASAKTRTPIRKARTASK